MDKMIMKEDFTVKGVFDNHSYASIVYHILEQAKDDDSHVNEIHLYPEEINFKMTRVI